MKYHTSPLHGRAEAAFESNCPVDSEAGLSQFLKCMLLAHLRFFHECDKASENAGLFPRSVELTQALSSDLNSSKLRIPPAISCNTHFCTGVGYVFEGSALGATVILKRLQQSNIVIPKYLAQLAADVKPRWPLFLASLDSCAHKDNALLGATTAFKYIIKEAESVKCLKE